METQGYNGWTNYETWAVKLWIDNEESSYHYWQDRAETAYREARASSTFPRDERAALDLADTLRDEIRDGAPDLGASLYADLLGASLGDVNWYEIGKAMIDDAMIDDAGAKIDR